MGIGSWFKDKINDATGQIGGYFEFNPGAYYPVIEQAPTLTHCPYCFSILTGAVLPHLVDALPLPDAGLEGATGSPPVPGLESHDLQGGGGSGGIVTDDRPEIL
jgi:hypothetical protein